MEIIRESGDRFYRNRERRQGDHKTPMLYGRDEAYWNGPLEVAGKIYYNPRTNVRGREASMLMLSKTFTPVAQQLSNNNFKNHVYNKALAKMDEQLNTATSLFEDWYERKATLDMATSAAKQVLYFLRNWKKPSYWKKIAKGAKQPKTLPDAWLAYNFGLKPLLGTIDHCANTLGREFPVYKASVKSRGHHLNKIIDGDCIIYCDVDYSVKMGCRAVSYNPNTSLIGVTGLNQPLTSFMAVVPWGWAADYFVNLSELCQNIDAKHPGLTVDQHWTTIVSQGNFNGTKDLSSDYYFYIHKRKNYPVYGYASLINRWLGTQNYKLELKLPLLGSSKFANLTSAIALSMKGK